METRFGPRYRASQIGHRSITISIMASTAPSNTATATSHASEPAGRSELVVEVRNWPLVDGGWTSVWVVTLTIAVALVSAQRSASPAMAILAALALMVSMWRFWLPVRYRLHINGIDERSPLRRRTIPWWAIQQCCRQERGVLIRFRRDGALASSTSSRLIQGHDQQSAMLAALEMFYRPGTNG
jgi:hypothetical protein